MSGGPVPYGKKYTAASQGVWNWLRIWLTPVANRSSGNPVVPWYRVPSTGSQPSNQDSHDVPSLPTAAVSNNQYFKRDWRRNYPQTSVFDQSAIAGLLRYGSVAQPRIAKGDEGSRQLATVANGEVRLPSVLQEKSSVAEIFDAQGLPPLPPQLHKKTYRIIPFKQHGMYSDDYPIRIFT